MSEAVEPKISFIIATKNRASLIKQTLESLITQTVAEWEAIIVDDHSTDETASVVASMTDSRFRYFQLPAEHGSGASCARNFGAIKSSASLVAILDSDDLCYPNRIEITLRAFAENPQADIFYANIDVWDEENKLVRERNTPFTEYSFEKIKAGNFITHPTVAMKRQVLLDNPYNQYFMIAEDYELYTRLAQQKKIFVWSYEKVLRYRLHPDNLSVGEDKKKITEAYGSLARMIRGWIPFDSKIFDIIEDQNENSHRRTD